MIERIVVTQILSSSWGGTIFAGRTADERPFHVRIWSTEPVTVGDVFDVEGEVREHKTEYKTIRQIEAAGLVRVRTSGRLIVPWLMSLDGVGRERAERIFRNLGDELLTVLGDPERLHDLSTALAPGRSTIGRKLAEYVQAQYAKRAAREDVGVAEVEFLQKLEELGVDDQRVARKLWRLIGSRAAYERLLERPYGIAAVMPWKAADALGQRLLSARGEPAPLQHDERALGAVDAAWLKILKNGSTQIQRAEFSEMLRRLGVKPDQALARGVEAHRVKQEADGSLRAPGASYLERAVAEHIRRIRSSIPFIQLGTQAFDDLTSLNPEQLAAVRTLSGSQFGILQGGAGVGKTTTVKAICEAHVSAGGSILLTAISGKAALRLSRATNRLAYTVARLVHGLERRKTLIEAGQAVPDRLPQIDANSLIVIDEASMVDLASWKRLLQLVPEGAKVILVGDIGQLPPVGLGRVYHDLVQYGVDVAQLTTVMRQAGGNPIIHAAAAIRAGTIPQLRPYSKAAPGIFHVPAASNMIPTEARRIYNDLLSSTPRDELLMLAARNDTCGSIAKTMQSDRAAEGHKGIRISPLAQWVACGDPVVATANRYDQALMNGLVGWVEQLDPLMVRFDGDPAPREVKGPARHELASAWCLTVHRAQGSEAKRVIILLDGPTLITREWLYTAVTRGVEQVVLIGPAENIRKGVDRLEMRETGFVRELQPA